jgi:hypothetical protein
LLPCEDPIAIPTEKADKAVNGNRFPTSIPNLGGVSDSKSLSQWRIFNKVEGSVERVSVGESVSMLKQGESDVEL